MHALRPTHRRFAAIALTASVVFTGACGDDNPSPSADELRAEAREQGQKAADEVGEAASDAADKSGEVAEDLADGPDEAKAQQPSVRILAPSDGSRLAAGEVQVKLETSNITIVAADGDTSGRTGHFHVFVDRDPVAVGAVIPKDADVVHSAANPVVVSGLSKGTHRLVVVLGDGTHKRLAAEAAEVSIEVA